MYAVITRLCLPGIDSSRPTKAMRLRWGLCKEKENQTYQSASSTQVISSVGARQHMKRPRKQI